MTAVRTGSLQQKPVPDVMTHNSDRGRGFGEDGSLAKEIDLLHEATATEHPS